MMAARSRAMREACVVAAILLMLCAICAAQMPPVLGGGSGSSQGIVPSSRADFGAQCGIQDTSVERALRFTRSAQGEWRQIATDERLEIDNRGVARAWHERNWMVDIHDAVMSMSTTRMHTAQMCFSGNGKILLMIDRFMDAQECGCMRYTALTFDEASGRVIRREQHYMNVRTGAEIQVPPAAADFPQTFEFRRLEQLPFWQLVK